MRKHWILKYETPGSDGAMLKLRHVYLTHPAGGVFFFTIMNRSGELTFRSDLADPQVALIMMCLKSMGCTGSQPEQITQSDVDFITGVLLNEEVMIEKISARQQIMPTIIQLLNDALQPMPGTNSTTVNLEEIKYV